MFIVAFQRRKGVREVFTREKKMIHETMLLKYLRDTKPFDVFLVIRNISLLTH